MISPVGVLGFLVPMYLSWCLGDEGLSENPLTQVEEGGTIESDEVEGDIDIVQEGEKRETQIQSMPSIKMKPVNERTRALLGSGLDRGMNPKSTVEESMITIQPPPKLRKNEVFEQH